MSAIPQFFVEAPQQLANETGKNIGSEVEGEELDGEFAGVLQQVADEQAADEQDALTETETKEGVLETVEDPAVFPVQVANAEVPELAEVAEVAEVNEVAELIDLDVFLQLDELAGEETLGIEVADGIDLETELFSPNEIVSNATSPTLTNQTTSESIGEVVPEITTLPGSEAGPALVSNPTEALIETPVAINPELTGSNPETVIDSAELQNQPLVESAESANLIDPLQNNESNVETVRNVELENENLEALKNEVDELTPEVDVVEESLEQTIDTEVDSVEVNRLSAQSDVKIEATKTQIDSIEKFSVDQASPSSNRGEIVTAVPEFANGEANVDVSSQDTQFQQLQAYPVEATQDPFHAVPEDVRDLLSKSVSRQTVAALKESLVNSKPPVVQSITLEIHPADLGKLNIQVEVVRDAIQATIVATENFSAELLERNKSDLVNALSDFGYGQANVDISNQNSQSQQQNNRNFQSGDILPLEQSKPIQDKPGTHVVQVGVNLVV